MSWELHAISAESLLGCSQIPSSTEIISHIKTVNPTGLVLPDADKERGYLLKGRLQNLLLENYGESFYLADHPLSTNIVLIKHLVLPSIDACHANKRSLSLKALDTVAKPASKPPEKTAARQPHREAPKPGATGSTSPKQALKIAQRWLEEYDYPEAEQVLSGIRISEADELPVLVKAVRILMDEMGGYRRAIETILAQPKHVIKDQGVRELLALSFCGNSMIPEARAIFDSTHPADLGKDALYAYADISFKDGNLSLAFRLLKLADEKEGFVTAFVGLRQEIERCMLAEAQSVFPKAVSEFERGAMAEASALVHEALELYPNFAPARELAATMEALKAEAETGRLWESYRLGIGCGERLEALSALLECDKGNREKIRSLIAEEKARQKENLVAFRLATLRECTWQGRWPECFDILQWFARQEDHQEQYREALALSPLFSVLHQNKRLERLPQQSAKELWLLFVEAKSCLQAGPAGECFPLLQKIRPFFHSYREFSEEYGRLLGIEQARAREEIVQLLAQAEADCTLSEATAIFRTPAQVHGPLAGRRACAVQPLHGREAPATAASQGPGLAAGRLS